MEKVLKVLEGLLVSGIALFAPIKGVLITTGVLIFADLITGLIAASKRKEKITSAGLRRTIVKILVYESALMLAFLAETYLSDILPFVKMAAGMVALVELKSIYENLNSASGMNLLKSLIEKLGSESKNK